MTGDQGIDRLAVGRSSSIWEPAARACSSAEAMRPPSPSPRHRSLARRQRHRSSSSPSALVLLGLACTLLLGITTMRPIHAAVVAATAGARRGAGAGPAFIVGGSHAFTRGSRRSGPWAVPSPNRLVPSSTVRAASTLPMTDAAASTTSSTASSERKQPQDSAGLVQEEVVPVVSEVPDYDHRRVMETADGLPLVYEPEVIKRYWDKRPSEMQRRWALFLSVTAPFFTKLVRLFTQGTILKSEGELARDLRIVLEKLGPTFIKLGQALSIRPDVVGPAATEELQKLQDAVPPFPNDLAFQVIDEELGAGRTWQDVFTDVSPQPVAAASLAQVYKARLKSNGESVAIKVQRPQMLETVSKDLYVMKRAVEVYQKYIVERFTAQTTDYQALLKVFATGFYEELDFSNEAKNQIKLKEMLADSPGVYVPKVYQDLSTRRLLVSEWVDGIKLTQAPPAEIRRVTKYAQEAFLRQLLEFGIMHADPHPGNLLLLPPESKETKGELAILDFGLVSEISEEDREVMVNALVHTANKDFDRLVEDLIDLKVLPKDTDRGKVLPVMTRVIGPYVFQGGGAKNLDIRSLSADLTRATLEIPFSIPPYFALVARALGILEGIALSGDPDYRVVLESYPYVSRRLMTDKSPRLQRALQDILYGAQGGNNQGGERLSFRRLSALLAYAMDVQEGKESSSNSVQTLFVDFDRVPSTGLRLNETMAFLLSDNAGPLRSLLVSEVTNASDLLLRQQMRRTAQRLPRPPLLPYPAALVDSLAPPLTIEEDVFLGSLADLGYSLLGLDPTAATSTLPRPDQVVSWLTQTQVREDALDVARLLQPGSVTGQHLGAFAAEVARGLADKALPRIERAVSLGPGGLLGVGNGASGREEGPGQQQRK